MTRLLIDEVWNKVCDLGLYLTVSKTVDKIYTHNALIWNNKLWICCGQGAGGTSHAVVILSYDLTTGVLTEEYNSAIGLATANCIWREMIVFNDNLYAGFTGQISGDINRGSIWKYNSTGSMTEVLDTRNFVSGGDRGILSFCEHNGRIWAGGGDLNTSTAHLYSSSTGASGSWVLEHTFTGFDYVRGLASWDGKLWIGTRANASLWSYDGLTYAQISNWPAEAIYQAKILTPFSNKLYIGCVNTGSYDAKIYSYDGSNFKTEINMANDHEIFHSTILNGKLYYAIRTDDNPTGGAIICTDGSTWREIYRDNGINFSHIHWVCGNNNNLYMSGSNLANQNVGLFKARTKR